jgi:hypothetical protein
MKRRMTYLNVLLFFIFVSNLFAADKQNFATKGILEFGGGISANGTFYENNANEKSSFSIGLTPRLNYYFIDCVHLGLVPVFSYSYYNQKDNSSSNITNNKMLLIGPQLSAGYTFKLSDSLFFDFSPFFQYNYLKYYYKNKSFNNSETFLKYGLDISLKYNIGNVLINTTLTQEYIDFVDTSSSDRYEILLGIGFTAYL